MQVIGDRIVVSIVENETVTEGGIILTQPIEKKYKKGKILFVGNNITQPLEVGQTIIFSAYVGIEVDVKGEKTCLIFKESEVFAVLN